MAEIDDDRGGPSSFTGAANLQREAVFCAANDEIGTISERRAKGEFVWLNLRGASNEEIIEAGKQLNLHPLTVEDLQEFNQRAKVEQYAGYVYIVAYGAAPADDDDRLVEIHIVYAADYLVTVAADTSVELIQLHKDADRHKYNGHELLHSVLDTLVDSYGPLLDDIDSEIEAIEEKVIDRDLNGRELDIHKIRKKLGRINRVAHRQSEAFTRLPQALKQLPDADIQNAPYFRDVQDHLIRVSDAADGLRDRVSGVFELYMAALNNRQNVIMKQFTVIAGIFLPLSVVTGFFGMNFGWLVGHIDSQSAFIILGLVFPFVIFVALVVVIRSRGLFRE